MTFFLTVLFVAVMISFLLQVLHMEMSSLIENSSLLYNFQKFMKREGALNILQFCLTVGKFNIRLRFPAELNTIVTSSLSKIHGVF